MKRVNLKFKRGKVLAVIICLMMILSVVTSSLNPFLTISAQEQTTENESTNDVDDDVETSKTEESQQDETEPVQKQEENDEQQDKANEQDKTSVSPALKTFGFAGNMTLLNADECVIKLQLDGSTADLTGAGWTLSTDDYYTQTFQTTAGKADLPILTKNGYVFGGWKDNNDKKYIAYQTKSNQSKCQIDVSGLADQTVTLTPIWQKYQINITEAVYDLPIGQTSNTVRYSLINDCSNLDINEMEEKICTFLNKYANTLVIDYTITYQNDEGQTITVTRSDQSLHIKWPENMENAEALWGDGLSPEIMADFRDVMKNLSQKNFTNVTPWVRLNDEYLKGLIAEAEKTDYTDYKDITRDNIAFTDWGNYDPSKKFFEDGDADATCIKINLGSTYNSKTGISGNEDYLIDTVSPSNVTLNLFDYWLFDQYYYDQHPDKQNNNGSKLVTSGVNDGHALLFRKDNQDGKWNSWTGGTGGVRQGIVQSKLSDGYPILDIQKSFNASGTWNSNYNSGNQANKYINDESLNYLFNVDTINKSLEKYGQGYSDVKGLFKINDDGNYYYSSHENFAEYDYQDNSFNVYNNWGVVHNGSSPDGQFFPFNSANQVFNKDVNGNIVQNGIKSLDNVINHYLGLTMEVDFQQPIDGMVSVGTNAKPMVFEFSGDDDVWIFIDDVLVADLGGIHDEMSVEIDFSTGNITIHRTDNKNPQNNNITTTLKQQFENAGNTSIQFDENTFASNTTHTLKMFYLERGNTDSNLTLSFNLMEPVENEIIKLDQNGDPVKDATFAMYVAGLNNKGQPIYDSKTGEYQVTGNPIAENITSDETGQADIPGNYDYSQHNYYVLRESGVPEGYFSPGDILLRYDRFEKHPDGTSSGTNLLLVDNRWTTGAVANFSANVYQSGTLKYDAYGDIDRTTGQNGLIVAVPLIKDSNGHWLPLYGSNLVGFNSIQHDGSTNGQRQAILEAALYQIYGAMYNASSGTNYGFSKWYLEWDADNQRYQGVLNDLPGDATRYYWASGSVDADLTMAYYFMDMEELNDLFGENFTSTDDKLQAIANKITSVAGNDLSEENIHDVVKNMVNLIDNHASDEIPSFALLNVSDFNRVFSSRIYVSNTQPQLGVQKLDQDGNPIAGVEFTLYSDKQCSDDHKVVSGTTNDEGLLVFSRNGTGEAGSAKMNFKGDTNYWLKETRTVDGYEINNSVIPVYVTQNGRIYADALDKNDGITVRKGLGKLLQTMVRYAGNGDINATLRDITAKLFTVDEFTQVNQVIGQDDQDGSILHLHYGLTNALMEYGTHEVNGVAPNPYFEVDENIAGIIVNQNYDAHEGDALYSTVALKTNLEQTNIRGLFSGSTTIVVRNRKKDSQGTFSIKKTVSGSDADATKKFTFKVSIKNNNQFSGNLDSSYKYQIMDSNDDNLKESGMLTFKKNGNEWIIGSVNQTSEFIKEENNEYVIKLKHNQKITVEGLPFEYEVNVTEMDADDYQTSISVNNGNWITGKTQAGIIEKPVGNPAFVFNNHKDKTTNLTVQKQLPDESDSDKAFPFEIVLRDQNGAALLTGSYHWQITKNETNVIDNGRDTSGVITNGALNITLKHDEKVVINNLPVGSTYIITETTQGYSPTVTVNGQQVQVVNGAISGTVGNDDVNGNIQPTEVVYTNKRSGSITLTKHDGNGKILSGAGFTLYTVDGDSKTKVGSEKLTSLAVKKEFDKDDQSFDKDAMRYNDGNNSYIVHTATKNEKYYYYRFLTEAERNQYYNGTFDEAGNVEAIVQFEELDLNTTYCIEETTVPNGYMQNASINNELSSITLPYHDDNDTYYDILYSVTNHAQMVLPTTGLHGIYGMLEIAIVFVIIAVLSLKYRKIIERALKKKA